MVPVGRFTGLGRASLSALVAALSVQTAGAALCPTPVEEEVVAQINQERQRSGLVPVRTEARLVEASRLHSEDMAARSFFSHTGSNGSSFAQRYAEADYPMSSGGENIGSGYATPAAVVSAWMASPGHRAIILTPGYSHVGVGYAAGGPYGHYWTADFGTSRDGGQLVSAYCVPPSPDPTLNASPLAEAGPDQTVPEGVPVVLNGSNSWDPDGHIASFRWAQTAGGPTVTLSSATVAQPTFTAPAVDGLGASLTFRLTVTDEEGLTATDSVVVHVADVDQPPVGSAGPDKTVEEGALVTLEGTGCSEEDDEGAIPACRWRQTDGPPVTLSDPTAEQPTFVAPSVGAKVETLTFELALTDDAGLKRTDEVAVQIVGTFAGGNDAGADGPAGGGGGGCFLVALSGGLRGALTCAALACLLAAGGRLQIFSFLHSPFTLLKTLIDFGLHCGSGSDFARSEGGGEWGSRETSPEDQQEAG